MAVEGLSERGERCRLSTGWAGREFTWIVFLCRYSLSQTRNSNQLYKYQELLKVDSREAKTEIKPISMRVTDGQFY